MENSNPTQPTSVNLERATPLESLQVLWTALNKASSAGVFSLDEGYALKVLHTKLLFYLNSMSQPSSSSSSSSS